MHDRTVPLDTDPRTSSAHAAASARERDDPSLGQVPTSGPVADLLLAGFAPHEVVQWLGWAWQARSDGSGLWWLVALCEGSLLGTGTSSAPLDTGRKRRRATASPDPQLTSWRLDRDRWQAHVVDGDVVLDVAAAPPLRIRGAASALTYFQRSQPTVSDLPPTPAAERTHDEPTPPAARTESALSSTTTPPAPTPTTSNPHQLSYRKTEEPHPNPTTTTPAPQRPDTHPTATNPTATTERPTDPALADMVERLLPMSETGPDSRVVEQTWSRITGLERAQVVRAPWSVGFVIPDNVNLFAEQAADIRREAGLHIIVVLYRGRYPDEFVHRANNLGLALFSWVADTGPTPCNEHAHLLTSQLESATRTQMAPPMGAVISPAAPVADADEVARAKALSQRYFDVAVSAFTDVAQRIIAGARDGNSPGVSAAITELDRVQRVVTMMARETLPLDAFLVEMSEIEQARQRLEKFLP